MAVVSAIYPPPKLENVCTLFDYGANLRAVDNEGRTALHLAVSTNQNVDIIHLLIKRGINRKAVDSEGKTAYQLACEAKCSQEIVDLLRL